MTEPFYLPLGGDRYAATKATIGPWDLRYQHGGPPVALLARAMERCEPQPDTLLARIVVDFLGPVPVEELTATARVVRGGRRVQLLEAELAAAGRPVLRARGWRLRWQPQDGLAAAGDDPPPPAGEPLPTPVPDYEVGYARAMQWLAATGSPLRPGPAAVWGRPRGELVGGEPPSPVQRVALVADAGNGISWVLDWQRWSFANVDLAVHLSRPPRGDWVCLSAVTRIDPGGVGLAVSTLYDEAGRIGAGAQALLVAAR